MNPDTQLDGNSSTPTPIKKQLLLSLQQPLVQYLLLFLLVLCVYVPTFWYTYVWDDWSAIAQNTSLREWENIPSFFSDPNTFMHDPKGEVLKAWRPLRNIYYLITYKMHGLHPAGWHFHHVLIHCLLSSVILVFFHRLYRLAMAWPAHDYLPFNVQIATWLAVFCWAVHPANTEVTAWLKSADDILACLFGIGALVVLIPPDHKLTCTRAIVGSVLFGIALLAKESIPPIALIYPMIITVLAPKLSTAIRNPAFLLATSLLMIQTIGYVLLRKMLLGKLEQVPYMAGSFSLMMATMTTAVVRYLQLTFWPFWPTVQVGDYKGWPLAQSWLDSQVLLSSAIMVLFLILIILASRRSRIFFSGWLFAALAFIPVANVVPMMQVMAERFMYFPLIGVTIALAAFYAWWLQKNLLVKQIWLPIVVGAALTLTTLFRLPVWVDSFTFQEQNAQALPENYRATYNYGVSLYDAGRSTEALHYMKISMKQKPRLDPGMGMALIYSDTGKTTEALSQLDEVIMIEPASPHPYFMKGNILALQNRTTEALTMYEEAIQRNPKSSLFHYHKAVVLYQTKNLQEAINSLNTALEINPDLTSATIMRNDLLTTQFDKQIPAPNTPR